MLLIRFLPPIPTHSPFIQPRPSRTRVRVAGQATIPPSQRSGGRGKWDAVVILEERNQRADTQCPNALMPQQECSTRCEAQCWECCNLSSHRFSWLELARTPSYSCIHCPPRLATNTVRQGLRVCPPENTSSPSEPMIFSNL